MAEPARRVAASPVATGRGVARARAALAGNPSDGYGGAVVAVTIDALSASACTWPAGSGMPDSSSPALIRATVDRFARELAPEAEGTAIEWATTIPRSVGLGGSSALVIATLRALCRRYDVALGPEAMAELALAVEVEDLGIAAGPQDRIAQAFGGLTFMDFRARRYERLDPARLPPLLIAWRATAAADSGPVHDDLRACVNRREPSALRSLAKLADAAREAADALRTGDHATLSRCADRSFDARAQMLTLDPRHVELIEVARAAGAGANYAGSGGAVVCVCRNERQRLAVGEALVSVGCGVVAQ